MWSKNLENSTSYDIFFINFGKKARVYYTLSISRGGAQAPGPPLDSPLHGNGVPTQWRNEGGGGICPRAPPREGRQNPAKEFFKIYVMRNFKNCERIK